jgi:hypothetical protein
MPLSWNEIRHRAIAFSREWQGETREAAERQSFWNDFFNVFGVRRRTVATFEEPVKKLSGDWGFIDLFWPGRLLAEHKSAGEDLGKAHAQGMAYIRGLKLPALIQGEAGWSRRSLQPLGSTNRGALVKLPVPAGNGVVQQ